MLVGFGSLGIYIQLAGYNSQMSKYGYFNIFLPLSAVSTVA